MAAFLYYLPGCTKKIMASHGADALPENTGLRTILNGASWTPALTVGPDNQNGLLLAVDATVGSGGSSPPIAYLKDQQNWIPVTNEEFEVTHWIGWQKDSPPTPRDLIRPETLGGHDVTVNGTTWKIPVVHALLGNVTLPRTIYMMAGRPVGEFCKEYVHLMREAERWFLAYRDPAQRLTDLEMYAFVCQLLNVNYRVGMWECSGQVLNITKTTEIINMVKAAVGLLDVAENEASLKN